MRLFLRILALLPLVVILQSLAPDSPSAQEADVAALHSKVRQLEMRIQELELLLKESEGGQKPAPGSPSGWQNKKNWRRLSVGMRDGEVKQILGEPSKVIQGVKTLWYYPNLYCGHVTFDDKGNLIGWNEP